MASGNFANLATLIPYDLFERPGLIPVSYTHLDVYKRQPYALSYFTYLVS